MRPLLATIDLPALRHNFARARQAVGEAKVFAVVKANALGHGVREVVTTLHDEVDGFVVSSIEEAAEVRALHGSARILLDQGCFNADEYLFAAQLDLDVALHSHWQVDQLLSAQLSRPLKLWLKWRGEVHLIGFAAADLRQCYQRLQGAVQVAQLNLLGECLGHERPSAEDVSVLQGLDFVACLPQHCAALLGVPVEWASAGAQLYGSQMCEVSAADSLGLHAVMSLRAELLAIHEVNLGDTVGAWRAARASRVGVVSCGYADGYPSNVANGASVFIDGERAPLIGHVTMDLLMVDLTDLPQACVGQAVELWGRQVNIDEVAHGSGLTSAELLSKVTARVPRRYLHR